MFFTKNEDNEPMKLEALLAGAGQSELNLQGLPTKALRWSFTQTPLDEHL